MVRAGSDVRDLHRQTVSEDVEGFNLAAHNPEFGEFAGHEHLGQGGQQGCGLLHGHNSNGSHSW